MMKLFIAAALAAAANAISLQSLAREESTVAGWEPFQTNFTFHEGHGADYWIGYDAFEQEWCSDHPLTCADKRAKIDAEAAAAQAEIDEKAAAEEAAWTQSVEDSYADMNAGLSNYDPHIDMKGMEPPPGWTPPEHAVAMTPEQLNAGSSYESTETEHEMTAEEVMASLGMLSQISASEEFMPMMAPPPGWVDPDLVKKKDLLESMADKEAITEHTLDAELRDQIMAEYVDACYNWDECEAVLDKYGVVVEEKEEVAEPEYPKYRDDYDMRPPKDAVHNGISRWSYSTPPHDGHVGQWWDGFYDAMDNYEIDVKAGDLIMLD